MLPVCFVCLQLIFYFDVFQNFHFFRNKPAQKLLSVPNSNLAIWWSRWERKYQFYNLFFFGRKAWKHCSQVEIIFPKKQPACLSKFIANLSIFCEFAAPYQKTQSVFFPLGKMHVLSYITHEYAMKRFEKGSSGPNQEDIQFLSPLPIWISIISALGPVTFSSCRRSICYAKWRLTFT